MIGGKRAAGAHFVRNHFGTGHFWAMALSPLARVAAGTPCSPARVLDHMPRPEPQGMMRKVLNVVPAVSRIERHRSLDQSDQVVALTKAVASQHQPAMIVGVVGHTKKAPRQCGAW